MSGSVHSEDTHMVRLNRLMAGVLGLFVVMMLAAPAAAQTGGLRGKVTDTAGKPVEGAAVLIEAKGVTRKLTVKTNKKGEFIQIGLYPGDTRSPPRKTARWPWPTTSESASVTRPWSIFNWPPPPAAAPRTRSACPTCKPRLTPAWPRARPRTTTRRSRRFQKAATAAPNCHDCYYNIGYRLLPEEGLRQRGSRVQEGHRAEAGLRRSVECARECLQRREEAR